jgi:hypothetical protein
MLINKINKDKIFHGPGGIITGGEPEKPTWRKSQTEIRRCKSFENFREFDMDWVPDKEQMEEDRCITLPTTPKQRKKIDDPLFITRLI